MLRVGAILAGIAIGAVAVWGIDFTVDATSTDEFCASCHEIADNAFVEFEGTSHALNAEGLRVSCASCHVPKAFLPKMQRKVRGLAELYGHLTGVIDTPEKYDAHRMTMASHVWADMEANDSRECRSCHVEAEWDLAAQSERAQRFHTDALSNGQTCISCHKGLAHDLPDGIEQSHGLEGDDL